jgi:ATP-binding cassette subfamily B protein
MPTAFAAPPERVESFLTRIPLFAEVDAASLKTLVTGSSAIAYDFGETVFKEGEAGDAFYVVVKGAVRVVTTPDPKTPDREVSLGTLGPGDHFGEIALLTKGQRTTTCRAAGEDKAVLIRTNAEAFQSVMERLPTLRERFLRLGDFYRTWNFLKVRTALGDLLGVDDLKRLVPLLARRQLNLNEVFVAGDDPSSPFVFVQTGSVRIVENGQPVGLISEGKYCGDAAILKGVPSPQRIEAAGEGVTVLTVPRPAFLEFLATTPSVREFLAANPSRPHDVRPVAAPEVSMYFNAEEVSVYLGADAIPAKQKPPATLTATARPRGATPPNALPRPAPVSQTAIPKTPAPTPTAPVPATPGKSTPVTPAVPPQEAQRSPAAPEEKAPDDQVPTKVKTPFLYRVYRFPFIRQHDERDCGAASLAMVARFYGKKLSLGRLRDLANVSTEGASLQGIATAAEQLGFVTRGVRVTGEPVQRQSLPAIVHWGGFHFVVLYKIDGRKAWIADPAIGLRRLTRKEFDASFTGFMLLLEPTDRLLEVPEAKTSFRRFLLQLEPYVPLLIEIALASLILDVLGLAAPLFTQTIVDKVIPHNNGRLLHVMLAGMLILSVFRIGAQAARGYLVANLSMRLDLKMLLKFYHHALALPISFFKLRKTGDILTRFGENAKLRAILTGSAVSTILDVFMVVVYLALMFAFNVRLTVAVLLFVPLFVVATLIFTPLLKRMSQRVFVANSDQESFLVESITGIETIKALAVERATRWRWEALFSKYLQQGYEAAKLELGLGSLSQALSSLSSIALLGYGATLVLDHELTIGQLMAFNALVGSVMAPIGALIQLWDKIQQAIVSMDRLNDVLDARPEEAGTELVDPREVRGDINFERIFFRYGTDGAPFVLENLSFKIKSGSTVAVVGRSGSGKSTLVRLVLKLHLPTEGLLTIDDLDIASISAQSLRRRIGFVPQEVNLFSGTIAENIALGQDEVDRRRVEEVAKIAEAHNFIMAMPLGYETLVGEHGNTLSGGQRQRISIARALYHEPPILIFDEATASLDTESEAAIQTNLKRILKGRTSIVIAHRMSTVRHADQILVLDKGRLVEEGDHSALMAQKGLYHQLVSRQLEL